MIWAGLRTGPFLLYLRSDKTEATFCVKRWTVLRRKYMDLACFIIWLILGAFAIHPLIKNETVHPLLYFWAVFVCMLLYAEKLLIG